MLIHVKEKEQTVLANYVVVLSMQNAHPILNGIVSLFTGKFFSRNQIKQGKKILIFSLVWQI